MVYNGGGVKPDVNVKESAVSNIAKSLQKNYVIFDYATYYRAKNNTIDDIKNFKLKIWPLRGSNSRGFPLEPKSNALTTRPSDH